ncbi:MAG: hypothetical protein AAGD38_14505 [Acidobacteriota bacterium]
MTGLLARLARYGLPSGQMRRGSAPDLDAATIERLATANGWSEREAREQLGLNDAAAPHPLAALARIVVATILFVSASYFVVAAILEGHSALFGEQGGLALFCLFILLVVLALFEGLQICVTLLRLKDIEPYARDFGRAVRLHRSFKSEEGTRRFLAGRQFFVVFVVFFIARITAFPGLRHVPFLDMALPSALDLLWFSLFDLGLMGAFVVLWIAQLAPQFGANRDPLAFLNLPGMGVVLYSSFLVDDLGITLPGFWFSSWVPDRPELSESRVVLFQLESLEGVGASVVCHRLRFHPDGTLIQVEKRLELTRGGFEIYEDDSLHLATSDVREADFDPSLHRGGATVSVSSQVEVTHDADQSTYGLQVATEDGGFEAGDALLLHSTFECVPVDRHRIEITEATRLVQIEVELADGVSGRVCIRQTDPHRVEWTRETELQLEGERDGTRAEHFSVFPHVGAELQVLLERDAVVERNAAVEAAASPAHVEATQD